MSDPNHDGPLETPAPAAAAAGWAGRVIGEQFQLVRRIGQGGMGTVWLADQIGIGRQVVVKVLLESVATKSPTAIERFRREAKASAALNHPNIVQLYTFGQTPEGIPYFAMEYVRGRTLRDRMAVGPIAEVDALPILERIAAALAEAHRAGVVHRDLKPENVMVGDPTRRDDHGSDRLDPTVKVLDFGIAKVIGTNADPSITQVGAVFGTPKYMSPEQATGKPVDVRTDVYAFGMIAYELLSGEHPFEGDTALDFMRKHVTEKVKPLRTRFRELGVSDGLDAVVARCLQKAPGDRYPTAAELQRDLRSLIGLNSTGSRTLAPAEIVRRRATTVALAPNRPWWLPASLGVLAIALVGTVVVVVMTRDFMAPPTRPDAAGNVVLGDGCRDRREAAGADRRGRAEPTGAASASSTVVPKGATGLAGAAAVDVLRTGTEALQPAGSGLALPKAEPTGEPQDVLDAQIDRSIEALEADAMKLVGAALASAQGALVPTLPPPQSYPGAKRAFSSNVIVTWETSDPIASVIAWYDSRYGKLKGVRRIEQAETDGPRLILSGAQSPAVPFLALTVMPAGKPGVTLISVNLRPE